MNFKYVFLLMSLSVVTNISYAYTQSDLFNAQTNFQIAKKNNSNDKKKLISAQKDKDKAVENLRKAESSLFYAQQDLKQKNNNLVIAKQDLAQSEIYLKNTALAVERIWSKLNGRVLGSPATTSTSFTNSNSNN